jgi:hypothetical protein
MTWTYSLSSLATSKKDQVRLVIGDTDRPNPITGITAQLMQDEEINFYLTIRNSIFGAAAECCRTLAAQFALLGSGSYQAGDTKIAYGAIAQAFAARAIQFDLKSALTCVPYVGGIIISDKENNEDNQDLVVPQCAIGMFDSNLPLGQLSVEAPEDTTGGEDR